MVLLAEAGTSADSWSITLLNYGVAGAMLIWFAWRDNRDSKKRDEQHKENIEQQKEIAKAFRTNTESIIIGISALQTLDASYAKLLGTVRDQNKVA